MGVTTVRDAVGAMGFRETDDGEVCCAIFREGKPHHLPLSVLGDDRAESHDNLYVATGLFRRNSVSAWSGRREENLASVVHLPFDFDLSPYLGMPKPSLHAADQGTLDGYVRILTDEVREVMSSCNIPVTGLIGTGYGVLALSQVDDADTGRIGPLRRLNKALVSRINRTMGFPFADPPVSDAGTRIVRVPGSTNTKNPDMPRTCSVLEWNHEARLRLDTGNLLDQVGSGGYSTGEGGVHHPNGTLPRENADRVVGILRSVWVDGSRHDVSLGVAALLGKAGVNEEQAMDIVAEVSDVDSERDDRLRAVETTYRRLALGQSVAGFTRLSEALPRDAVLALQSELHDLRASREGLGLQGVQRLQQTPSGPVFRREPRDAGQGEGEAAARVERYRSPLPQAYFGWFGRYRNLMSPTAETPDVFHLAVALTLAGIYIGRRASTYYFSTLYPNLYTVLVGDTGKSRKTTAVRRGKAFFNSLGGVDGYRMPFSQIRGLSTAEGLLESLSRYPKALVEQDEFSHIIAKGRQESSATLLPTLTELWDAPDYQQLLTRANPLLVERPTIALIAATTPQTLALDLGSRHVVSGFANRILFAYGEGKGFLADAPPVDTYEQRALMRDLRDAVDALPQQGHEFSKSTAAAAYWREVYRDFYNREHETFDAEHMAQRVPANIHRVALIHAVAAGASEIAYDHVEAARAFVMCCFENACRHAATWGSDDDAKLANDVITMIESHGEMSKQSMYYAVGQRSGPSRTWKVLDALSKVGAIHIDEWGIIRPRERRDGNVRAVEQEPQDVRPA